MRFPACPLDLMNNKKFFQLANKKNIDELLNEAIKSLPNEELFNQLAWLIAETLHDNKCDVDGITANATRINQELNRHLGADSTIASHLKQNGFSGLQLLYRVLNDDTYSSDEKCQIATRLEEGVSHCSPGFLERIMKEVNSLLMEFSIPGLLGEYRSRVVQQLLQESFKTIFQRQYHRFGMHVHMLPKLVA